MKKSPLIAAIVAAFLTGTMTICFAQKAGPHDAEFQTFFNGFLKALAANDKEKIADMIKFPVSDWSVEAKGDVHTVPIKDREEFLRRYSVFMTNSMRLRAAKAKPQPLQDGRYTLIWKTADVECSFEFEYVEGTGYRVTAYGVGPL
jgi:hypothetical protein